MCLHAAQGLVSGGSSVVTGSLRSPRQRLPTVCEAGVNFWWQGSSVQRLSGASTSSGPQGSPGPQPPHSHGPHSCFATSLTHPVILLPSSRFGVRKRQAPTAAVRREECRNINTQLPDVERDSLAPMRCPQTPPTSHWPCPSIAAQSMHLRPQTRACLLPQKRKL